MVSSDDITTFKTINKKPYRLMGIKSSEEKARNSAKSYGVRITKVLPYNQSTYVKGKTGGYYRNQKAFAVYWRF